MIIMRIMNNTMTILVPSPDNSRDFATLVEILQPQISVIIL